MLERGSGLLVGTQRPGEETWWGPAALRGGGHEAHRRSRGRADKRSRPCSVHREDAAREAASSMALSEDFSLSQALPCRRMWRGSVRIQPSSPLHLRSSPFSVTRPSQARSIETTPLSATSQPTAPPTSNCRLASSSSGLRRLVQRRAGLARADVGELLQVVVEHAARVGQADHVGLDVLVVALGHGVDRRLIVGLRVVAAVRLAVGREDHDVRTGIAVERIRIDHVVNHVEREAGRRVHAGLHGRQRALDRLQVVERRRDRIGRERAARRVAEHRRRRTRPRSRGA